MSSSNLKVFVEEKTKVCKDDPQFLPTVGVLELALQTATQLVLSTQQTPDVLDHHRHPCHNEPIYSVANKSAHISRNTDKWQRTSALRQNARHQTSEWKYHCFAIFHLQHHTESALSK